MASSSSSFVFKVPPLPVLEPEEVGISRPLSIKCLKECILALYTPFVVCLAAGNLTIHGFHHYISQNFQLLMASMPTFNLLEGYAVADEDKTKLAELRRSALNEWKDFDKDWGSNIVKEDRFDPATTKYTNFLFATASGELDGAKAAVLDKSKIIPYTLGVMVGRLRLFAFFLKEIQPLLDATDSDHPYKEHVDKSFANFEASARNTEALLDKLSAGLTKDEHDTIEKLYRHAMILQLDFLSAQPLEKQETVIPLCKELKSTEWRLLLLSGFEQTCTAVVDPSVILIEISILTSSAAKQNKPDKDGRIKSFDDCQKQYDEVRRDYNASRVKVINDIVSTSEKAEQYSYERLFQALEDLSFFEEETFERAVKRRLFKGMYLTDIQKAGRRLILQDGCRSFLQKVVQNKNLDVNVHVVSCCWCQDLVKSAFSSGGLEDVNVHANEFMYDDRNICTGNVGITFESTHGKLDAFEIFNTAYNDEKGHYCVYIGGSLGDLLCLLKADIGIVIGSCPRLRRVGHHFGVSFVPLFEGIVRKQKNVDEATLDWEEPAGTLYTVHCWDEIQAFFLGFT